LNINFFIKKIDSKFFNSFFYRKYHQILKEDKLLNHRVEEFNHILCAQQNKNKNSKLNYLCDKYGSDKGEIDSLNNPYEWESHTYTDIYDLMFRFQRKQIKLLLECGLGTNNPNLISSMGVNGKPGASLRVWRDYFPNALILGVDIDKDILFQEKRIKTYYCDQTNKKSIRKFCNVSNLKLKSIDIIIDDGLHEFFAGISFFESMFKYLSTDGFYIIEDVIPEDIINYKNYFSNHIENLTISFFNLNKDNKPAYDNRMILIRKN